MRLSAKASFIAALVILATCALSMEAATRFLSLHFRKAAVQPRQPMEALPARLGQWVQVTPDRPLPEDAEHVLGTSQYVMRVYVDSRIINPDLLAGLKGLSDEELHKTVGAIQREHPEAVVSFWITYYTGMADTVAHVPDRCYIADGYNTAAAQEVAWSKSAKNVRYLTFEDASGVGRVQKNVAYCFSVNGQYVADPIDVRAILGNLFSKYGYYAKIELMTQSLDREKAAGVMDDFLSTAMPSVEPLLPDWTLYQGK